MGKRFEGTINKAYGLVSEKLKTTIIDKYNKYGKERSDAIGFGNIATFIFKDLNSKERAELMWCATDNKLMTNEATQKRMFYLIKKVCGRDDKNEM